MAGSSRTAFPPGAALSNRDRKTRTRSGKQPVATFAENTTTIDKSDYQSNVLTRSQRAQTIEVPLDGQPPIWERKSAEHFWNPVVGSKPDWCWARRKNEVISEEMPVVLAVNDGERPTTALEREETVLVQTDLGSQGEVAPLGHCNRWSPVYCGGQKIRRSATLHGRSWSGVGGSSVRVLD